MAKEVWHRWHRCEPWNARKLPCPYKVLKEDEPAEEEDTWIQEQGARIGESWIPRTTQGFLMQEGDLMAMMVALSASILESGIIDARGSAIPPTVFKDLYGIPSFPPTAEFAYAKVASQLTWLEAIRAGQHQDVKTGGFVGYQGAIESARFPKGSSQYGVVSSKVEPTAAGKAYQLEKYAYDRWRFKHKAGGMGQINYGKGWWNRQTGGAGHRYNIYGLGN